MLSYETKIIIQKFFSRQTRFIRSLPKTVSKDKQFCQDLHNVFVQQTMEAIRENFDQVEDSSKLESNLKQLDVVVSLFSCKRLIQSR